MTDSDVTGAGMTDRPDLLVVTHPLGNAGENATRTLLNVLAAVTSVALVTANLPSDSTIREDHEVIELTTRDAGSSIPVAAFRFLANQLMMCRTLWQRDEQVVLFFGATAYLLPIIAAKLRGKTVVLEPRGDVPLTLRLEWEQRVPNLLARFLAGLLRGLELAGYRLADGIVTYTPGMATQLGLDRFDEKLYPTGARYVDTDRFEPAVPFEQRDRVVGFVGRLDEEKGIRTLAAAVTSLPDDVTFRFIGDGALRDWLGTALSEEIAAGRVEAVGWVEHDEVPKELNKLRLLVLCSEPTEGLPTTILEAMACGTPVYATPVSGVPDVVREGETGFLMNVVDARTIADDIETILGRHDLGEYSENGRALVEREYRFERAVERYAAILEALK